MGMRFAQNMLFYIYTVFVPGYGEKTLHYTRNAVLGGVLASAVLGLFAIPLWSHLSDRVGRRPIYLGGALVSLLVTFPSFWLMGRGPGLLAFAIVLAMVAWTSSVVMSATRISSRDAPTSAVSRGGGMLMPGIVTCQFTTCASGNSICRSEPRDAADS